MVLIFEEREAIEPDHLVGDATFAELIRYGFGHHHYNLCDDWGKRLAGMEGREGKGTEERANHRR